MKVKYKLFLSLLFLFGVVLLLGGVGIYYLKWLAADTAAILKDNNRTLNYMRSLEGAVGTVQYLTLTEGPDAAGIAAQLDTISRVMARQQANVTEPGEQALTDHLGGSLAQLAALYPDTTAPPGPLLGLVHEIKTQINNVYLINEATMTRKNQQAADTARKVVLYMGLITSISIVVGLIFITVLPGYISRPLQTFDEAIRQISGGNYGVVIPSDARDEYGDLAESFNLMAAKLSEYGHSNLSRLIKEQKRLNAVINQLDEAILGLDENKQVIFANDHCLRLLGLERQDLMGRYAPDVATHNALLNRLIQELMIGFMDDETRAFRPIKVAEDGKEKLFARNVVDVVEKPTGEKRRVLMGHVVILTDISAFDERDRAKTHFMATLSHELKTPVSAIQMSIGLLRHAKSGTLTPDQQELLTTVENNNERIRKIINELLDLSRIESGTIDLTLTDEDATLLVDRAVEGVRPFLEEKRLTVGRQHPPQLPAVRVDAQKTVWILTNLLTNAVRHAPAGSAIDVRMEAGGPDLKIWVVDHGEGIAPADQERIFQKFTRLAQPERTGTGLGLAICKEFIEAMGGSIGVSSAEGGGASFWIGCPVAKEA